MNVYAHLQALLLALASSTDNFCVGFAVGLQKSKRLSLSKNAVIAICNAFGAWAATFSALYAVPSSVAPLLAAFAFGFLAFQEVSQKSESATTDTALSYGIAIPMTLNNLAGGVAGGAAGITPYFAFLYALLASFSTMQIGYWIGRQVVVSSHAAEVDPSRFGAGIFGVLALWSLFDAFSG